MVAIRSRRGRFMVLAAALTAATLVSLIAANPFSQATSGGDPYSVPLVTDTNPDPTIVETTLTSDETTVDIGNGVTAQAQAYNGAIPGPTFNLNVGDTAIVHYENDLAHESGIHWHGIELANAVDGTPFTQNMVPPNGAFLYKFTVTRPGLYWYHPHHHSSTNQVFKGLYGMIIVRDPNEAALQASGTLPSAAQTKPIVLSDVTVCKAPGTNPGTTAGAVHAYDDNADNTPAVTAPWAGSAAANALPAQAAPSPQNLCEGPDVNANGVNNDYPADENGDPRGPFAAGEIPNTQTKLHAGRTNEGQTVLTNGKNVGARAGGPANQGYVPGALVSGASVLNVQPGQGLRLQILNAATTRYMRLQLTRPNGVLVPLVRVGGEGGLIDNAVQEGGVIPPNAYDTEYDPGEILLPPGTRADVVAAIPSAPTTGVLTLWTEDYNRTGGGFVNIPSVPVMHLNLAGPTVVPAYTIDGVLPGVTPLRAATGDFVPTLGGPTGTLLNPAAFAPAKLGMAAQNVQLTANASTDLGIDGTFGTHDVSGDYSDAAHLGSTRYAEEGDTLQLTVQNATGGAHHPFHLHGFSIQPVRLDDAPFGGAPGAGDFVWPYREFRDNVDIPPGYRLDFRVKLDPRPLVDGTTAGGALGRWLFHCHIFFHATNGMISELVVVPGSGNERPDVNVNGTQVVVNQHQTATISGTYKDRDANPVALSSSVGTVTDTGGGNWAWSFPTGIAQSQFVYVTATDSTGLKGQMLFFLKVNNISPVIKGLKATPKIFAPAARSTPLKRASASAKVRRGTKIRFNLSEAATVRFTVKRILPQRPRLGQKRFSRAPKAGGKKAVRFTGRFRGKALPPGRYRLFAQATDSAGLRSTKPSTTFKIVAG